MEYREQGVRVGPSPYGLGVFSMRSFAVHEIIGPIYGTVVDDPQYGSDYCMELGSCSALEPDPPFRYVNHSCRPNCELVEIKPETDDKMAVSGETNGDGALWLEVLIRIAPGEQLTIDYAWPAWAAVPCACGAPECRGWIVAKENCNSVPSALPQQQILSRFPPKQWPYLRRLYHLWMKWNLKFFAGRLTVPEIVLSRSVRPNTYGCCGPSAAPGCRSQIRLQLSLLTGTHPSLRLQKRTIKKRFRLVAEVLLHEMVHQWGREVVTANEYDWRDHGVAFCEKCNEIGRQLRLLPVSIAHDAKHNPTLASCARWPHNARRALPPRKPATREPS